MERLTKRDLVNGIPCCYPQNDSGLGEIITKSNPYRKIIEKLKYYEDLEEQGLMKIFPCALNSTVYCIDTFFYEDTEKCIGCRYFHEGDSLFRDDACCVYCDENGNGLNPDCLVVLKRKATLSMLDIWIKNNSFGKTVFLTQEEAKEVLRGMEENT